VRAVAPDLPLLVPGVGAQGGDLAMAVGEGQDGHGAGVLISSSRAILYASRGADWQQAARAAAQDLRVAINGLRRTRAG
jgi:orotidine-5'-phosphate decarboxylase